MCVHRADSVCLEMIRGSREFLARLVGHTVSLYAKVSSRPWVDVVEPNGRDLPLVVQGHLVYH
jgi:hypothetical protein